jgi:ubiquinone/menaquinone biosynthesis C-methylase UbiE
MMSVSSGWDTFQGEKIPSSLELQAEIYEYIEKESKILDVGCGYGKTVFELLKKDFKSIQGIDPNETGVNAANTTYQKITNEQKKIFQVASAISLPFEKDTFDLVITQAFWTAIISQQEQIMTEIHKVLKPGGFLYITDFSQNWQIPKYKERYEAGLRAGLPRGAFQVFDEKTGKEKFQAKHYTKEELENFARQASFKTEFYKSKVYQTQTGSTVNGHLFIFQK